MQTRKMKYFFEDYVLYPILYIVFAIVAVIIHSCMSIWDLVIFIASIGKKK